MLLLDHRLSFNLAFGVGRFRHFEEGEEKSAEKLTKKSPVRQHIIRKMSSEPLADGWVIKEVTKDNWKSFTGLKESDVGKSKIYHNESRRRWQHNRPKNICCMSVPELKDECKSRNLPLDGNKSDLLLRLLEDDKARLYVDKGKHEATRRLLTKSDTELWSSKMLASLAESSKETLKKANDKLSIELQRTRSELQRIRSVIDRKATEARREIEAVKTMVAAAKTRESSALTTKALADKALLKASSECEACENEMITQQSEYESITDEIVETTASHQVELISKMKGAKQRLAALKEKATLASSLRDSIQEVADVANRDLATARSELADAHEFAKEVGLRLDVIDIAESSDDDNDVSPTADASADVVG